jgi:hypothetical protein
VTAAGLAELRRLISAVERLSPAALRQEVVRLRGSLTETERQTVLRVAVAALSIGGGGGNKGRK